MKTFYITALVFSVLAAPDPGHGQGGDLVAPEGSKICINDPVGDSDVELLEIKPFAAKIRGDLEALEAVDGRTVMLDPEDESSVFGLNVEFLLPSGGGAARPFFFRIVARTDSPIKIRTKAMSQRTNRFESMNELRSELAIIDYVFRVSDTDQYVFNDGRVSLRLVFQFFEPRSARLGTRGITRIGIDIDKIEIIE